MLRRLPTTIALAIVAAAFVGYAVLWGIAVTNGHVDLLSRPDYGNHGPWRHHRTLRTLDEYLTLFVIVGGLPSALLGGLVEPTRRSGIVMALVLVAVAMSCAHFPLFD